MNGNNVSRCVACNCNLTVGHILIVETVEVRQIYYDAENLQLFQEILPTYVFDFLCKTRLFNRRYCLFMIKCEGK